MKEKIHRISLLEGLVLLLTILFAAGTLWWFHGSRPEPGVTLVETGGYTEAAPVRPEPEAPGMLEGEVLDLNTASLSDLTRLPGIGQTKAQAILDWRAAHGPFQTVEDLLSVDGIGEKTLENLRPYVAAD